MARISIEPGISYDEKRKLYYVCLVQGKNSKGQSTKTYVTEKSILKARKIYAEHQKKRQRGEVLPVETDTLAERIEQFINFKELSLAEATIYGYRNLANNHIIPYFKKKKIQDISVTDIKGYIQYLAKKKHLSNTTIRKHLDFLNLVFKEAYRERIIKENPLEFIDKIKPDTKEKLCFTPEELRDVLRLVEGTTLETAVYLAAFLGLRREEVAGLKWENVDLENRVLHIVNVRTQVGNQIVEKDPKTKRSERSMLIPEPVYNVLVKEKNKLLKRSAEKRQFGVVYVVTKSTGEPYRPNYFSAAFKEFVVKNNLKPVTFHGLRHTFASIANAAGTPLQEIAASMGHADPGVTSRVYSHEFTKVKSAAVDAVTKSLLDKT